ncbi:hypothetical protein PFICI_06816 [Pestalotiopsis fici W106-1]|uniref:Enoyl reductase (ER) domain-containing protein n=1 Tax=Pestalotiopsis fici (strain W106-1 / CGMCC3.15140) TaxID=1229662 RepID=W3X716_PESFW|nr:uncharacterized protein PFICI_06816 [Pestalotiopsis fici W106-1]ETS81814.1 hypothetical protein PFICI_06816 [Pestalotiopsis fici W106-1]
MAQLPTTMRSLIAPTPCKPKDYDVVNLPVPVIQKPDEILIKVHAAGFMTGDSLVAAGSLNFLLKNKYPIKLGVGGAGVVVAVGSAVTKFQPGDAVYGGAMSQPMTLSPPPGFCSEYCIGRERYLLPKPPGVSFEEAAGLLGNTLTAVESLELGAALLSERSGRSLEGATVLVPGALSATGHVALQLLRNVYGAGRIVTTASTAKVPLVEERLGSGIVDQVVDYTATPRLTDVVPAGSVDFAYNTQFTALTTLVPLLRPDTGVIVSVASMFPSRILKLNFPSLPFWLGWAADLVNLWYHYWMLRGTNVVLDQVSGSLEKPEIVKKTADVIAQKKVRCVMRVVPLSDLDALRKECEQVYTGKGGIGSLVIKMV